MTDQIASFPNSSKSQKSVKSTKSSKGGKSQFTSAISRQAASGGNPNSSVVTTSLASKPHHVKKQSPSVEHDQTRIEKLQSAPKSIAKKKPAHSSNKATTGHQQSLSQKKQQRVKFNVVNSSQPVPASSLLAATS